MIEKIFLFYEEYKAFMDLNNDSLPNIIPITKEDDGVLACIYSDEVSEKSANLYYCEKIFAYSERFQKAKFFHEFTHIFDCVKLSNKYSEDDLATILSTYSEYHASQIELVCNIGFENIHKLFKINLNKTYVETENGKIEITDEYLSPLSKVVDIISEPSDFYINLSCDEYYSIYKKFHANTMYYLGKQNFCSKISLNKISNITQKTYLDFYMCISEIDKCIKTKEFDKLIELDKLLFKKFFYKYPNYDFQKLIAEYPEKYL